MRVKRTFYNVSAGVGSHLIATALSFVTRTVFIHSLGIEYLGISGLFTSMLAMLSLAEAGIGSSIVYNLYKPVAQQDEHKMLGLMRLYRKAYWLISGVVFALGLAMMPFFDVFIKDTSVDHLVIIYLLFLVNTAVPYLYVYKHSFLNVNQKNYIVTSVFTVSTIISTGVKVAILLYTENYILYLIVESIISIVTSFILAAMVDKMYPFLKTKAKVVLDAATRHNVFKNMKAIILQNIGVYFIFGVDSILISSFISVTAVGLYSNYKMLIDICRTFANQLTRNMYHSVGNLVAQESAEKVEQVYKVMALLNFWLYSSCSIILILFVAPFITLWLGTPFLLTHAILIVLVVTFYERGMRNAITTVKTTAGIFHADRFAPLCQAAISLLLSIVLVQYMGMVGIFIGSLLSSLSIPFWLTPYLVYRRVFRRPVRQYYLYYFTLTLVGFIAYGVSHVVCLLLPDQTFYYIVLQAVVCFIAINALYVLLFYKTEQFNYLKNIVIMFKNKWHTRTSRIPKSYDGLKRR